MLPNTLSVLIVDDERTIADSLTAIVKSRGYRAQAAYDGLQALNAASEVEPHVLISDVMMPHMNGIELARQFAQKFPTCKVLLMSGNIETVALLAASEREGYNHTLLPKPVHPSEILDFLGKCSPSV